MNPGPYNFIDVEKRSIWRIAYHIFSNFCSAEVLWPFPWMFCWKWEKCIFQFLDYNFGTKRKLKILLYPSALSTYSYIKFKANPRIYNTQNACLERSCFGESQHGEKSQNVSCLCASRCEILWYLVVSFAQWRAGQSMSVWLWKWGCRSWNIET